MTSVTATPSKDVAAPQFAAAGRFLDVLAARDFSHLASAVREDVVLRALLPPGPAQYEGVAAVQSAFDRWFGGVAEFDVLDAAVGEVCDRLQLHWRVRVRVRADDGRYVIEQRAYADPGADGRIARLDLLCSGYRPEISGE
ncbi:MAG: nuclear transport factor 2 family protein [Nocardioidaceae bacterium]